jgi:NAD dependent epimerase/dehydratase family enzyme
VRWQPQALSPEAAGELRGADAVVYLAGGPLFDGRRHSRADIEAETRARIGGITTLVAGMTRAAPAVFIAASSVGYYGYGKLNDADHDETSPAGDDWWGQSSETIEAAALAACNMGSRTVVLRTGYVLTPATIQSQVTRFRRHLGGWIGTGLPPPTKPARNHLRPPKPHDLNGITLRSAGRRGGPRASWCSRCRTTRIRWWPSGIALRW